MNRRNSRSIRALLVDFTVRCAVVMVITIVGNMALGSVRLPDGRPKARLESHEFLLRPDGITSLPQSRGMSGFLPFSALPGHGSETQAFLFPYTPAVFLNEPGRMYSCLVLLKSLLGGSKRYTDIHAGFLTDVMRVGGTEPLVLKNFLLQIDNVKRPAVRCPLCLAVSDNLPPQL